MKLTRKQALAGAAAGAIGASGIYELVDKFAGDTPARADTKVVFPEQHLLDGIRVVSSEGIAVLVTWATGSVPGCQDQDECAPAGLR